MKDSIRQVQLVEYEILKELDRICKKHDIKYWLGQGTLLGAAKYQKFIPWDDDIDLLIPWQDLKNLQEVFEKEAKEEYLLTNVRKEKHFPLSWTKIRNTKTLSRPAKYKDIPINWGICIDLFPVYPLSDNKLLRKLEIFMHKLANKMLMAGFTKYEEGHGFVERFFEKIPVGVRILARKTADFFLEKGKENSEYVLVTCKGAKCIKRDLLWGEECYLPFEDGEYRAPNKYHEYLTLNYGDYMAPLPENEQRGHDLFMGEIEWKLNI